MGEQRDRLDRGEWYLDDDELRGLRRRCARQLDVFNGAPADADDVRSRMLDELLGTVGDGVVIVPRLQCKYGFNVHLGEAVFINANAFLMDDAPITIGASSRVGPGAQLMTALHPVEDHRRRREGWERVAPIVIEDNVWLGASVTVGPGVRIGRNSVIGAGSVVLRDVPDHVVAAGTPATVVRQLPAEVAADH